MERRAHIIDILRGLAILGMVLSGQMLWHADLPAWLFHAQLPPPTFAFNPEVPGITWVDLVFPFFLFSMGAAFPLALGRKLEREGAPHRLIGGVVKRWALLLLFALAMYNLRAGWTPGVPAWGAALVSLAAWGCFVLLFLRFERVKPERQKWLRIAGGLGLAALAVMIHCVWGCEISLHKSDTILLILANMVLLGSLIWLYTREKPLLRLAILALLVALRIGSEVEGSWNEALYGWTASSWLFRFDFLKYLCIILPATFAGEAIDRWLRREESAERGLSKGREGAILLLVVLLFGLNMWGLFTRHLVINLVGSLLLGGAIGWLQQGSSSSSEVMRREIFSWGLFWLVLGLFCEAFEGGIKKDYATFSYLFVTSGLASLVLIGFSSAMEHFGLRCGMLIRTGQNPMVAYTTAEWVVMPILTLAQLAPWVAYLSALGPWCGFLRGVAMTLVVMLFTAWATRHKFLFRT